MGYPNTRHSQIDISANFHPSGLLYRASEVGQRVAEDKVTPWSLRAGGGAGLGRLIAEILRLSTPANLSVKR